ncbi:MAG: D-2-hydroxyacid dehydrogenase [Burkholderiaceae bacterium]
MSEPLRILLSLAARDRWGARIERTVADADGRPVTFVAPAPGADAEIALVSREITGLSTKHHVLPDTQRFYDALLGAPSLRWVHVHSAGADRPVYVELVRRGLALTTSSGSNAAVVAQTALAGMLALARHFPQLIAAQREHAWRPQMGADSPRDLQSQTALVVGWGPIGQTIGAVLLILGLRLLVARSSAVVAAGAERTVTFEDVSAVLPQVDWLILACPLTDRTRHLVDAAALARLPAGARLVNVARGDVVDEPALIAALQARQLAGAYLDVYAHEPLAADSPIWDLPNVIATPHSAGFSDGNAERVAAMFLANLEAWCRGRPLALQVGAGAGRVPDERGSTLGSRI